MPYIGNTTSDFSIDTGNITNRAVTATKLSPSSVGSNGQVLSVDGSGNLQWSADASGTSLTGSTNNTITTVTGANAIQGEANLTFNNSVLSIINTSNLGDAFLYIKAGEAGASVIELQADEADENNDLWRIQNAGDSKLGFRSKESGSWVEKLGITADGNTTFAGSLIISEDNAIHLKGATDSDKDSIVRESSGNALLINSRNDAIVNIDSNADSTDAHFAVAHGAATSGSTELFRVQENGKVGIGASSPEETLDLGNSTQMNLKIGGRGYIGQAYSTAATIIGHSVKAKTTGTISGGMIVTETNSGGGAPSALRMQSGNIEFHTAASGTQDADFNSNERMRIDNAGRVGIGVTPSASEGTELAVKSSDGQTNFALIPGADTQSSQINFYNAAYNSTQGFIKYDNNNNSLTVRVNLNIALTIDNSQNATFTGEVNISGAGATRCNMRHSSGGNFVIKNPTAADLSFGTNNNDAELVIKNGGKVGIGTTNPTGIHNLAKVLELSGGDGGDLIIGNSVSTNIGAGAHIGAIAFKNIDNSTGSSPHYAGIRCEATDTSGNMDLRFYTGIANLEGDTPQFYINSTGKVGINTTSPASVLEVRGVQGYADSASTLATAVSKSAFRVRGSNNSSDSLWMGVETTDANPYIQGANDPGNAAKKLLLNPFGGHVGIGDTSPDCKLHVNAGIADDALKIESTDNAVNFILTDAAGSSSIQQNNDMLNINSDPGSTVSASTIRFNIDGVNVGTFLNNQFRLGSNSAGIQFHGDTAAANSLDDYEEGTWTPTVHGSSNKSVSQNYKSNYVKIGCHVHCQTYIALSGTGNSNGFNLGGLPFTNRTDGFSTNVADFGKGGIKGAYARVNGNTTYAEFLYSSENPSNDRLLVKGDQVGNGYFISTISYMTDA